ncbi:DnaJ domain [Popillia japonica]|uniref:DnaJ domain n=1 Tax=Popillia japonica TaxID=7064 RepID=A0AAW1J107_POPJA
MSDLLSKCEEYYGTRNFYEVLSVSPNASEKEIKKAYHKLSLLVHPDRVEEAKKAVSTEKFKVLGKIYSILQNIEKRKVYDDSGEFDEDSYSTINWMEYWRSMFPRISTKDIENYEKEYIGSETEIYDVKRAYISSKGNMDVILEYVPFSNCDSEPRIIQIVRKLVDNGEVEEHDCFFNEPQKKKNKRRRKWEAERLEAEKLNLTDEEIEKSIRKNQERRHQELCSFMSNLEKKYCKPKKRQSIKDSPSPTKKTRRSARNK